jgi:hypothetical protein
MAAMVNDRLFFTMQTRQIDDWGGQAVDFRSGTVSEALDIFNLLSKIGA